MRKTTPPSRMHTQLMSEIPHHACPLQAVPPELDESKSCPVIKQKSAKSNVPLTASLSRLLAQKQANLIHVNLYFFLKCSRQNKLKKTGFTYRSFDHSFHIWVADCSRFKLHDWTKKFLKFIWSKNSATLVIRGRKTHSQTFRSTISIVHENRVPECSLHSCALVLSVYLYI